MSILKESLLTASTLRSRVNYDPASGRMIWKSCRRRELIGKPVGYKHGQYRVIEFSEGRFFLHRLAWLYVHGEWPPQFIDHINGDPADNRIANLRPASPLQNLANRRPQRGRKFKGITASGKRWRSQIRAFGKTECLGTFDTPEDAHAAYAQRALQVHGKFARVR